MQNGNSNSNEGRLPPFAGENALRASVYRASRKHRRPPEVARIIAEAAVLKGRALFRSLGLAPRTPNKDRNPSSDQ